METPSRLKTCGKIKIAFPLLPLTSSNIVLIVFKTAPSSIVYAL